MGSSGGGGGGGNPQALMQQAAPMANIPIAGAPGNNVTPQNYGNFQSFLPDIPAAGGGPAPSATGLTNEMFTYKSPQGDVAPNEADALRNEIAKLMAAQAAKPAEAAAPAQPQRYPWQDDQYYAGGNM